MLPDQLANESSLNLGDDMLNWLDRAIGVFAPGVEAKRLADRIKVDQIRQFAAAKNLRASGDWRPIDTDINSLIRSGSEVIRNRTAQLVNDFAYFARAVNNLVDFTVGEGITFQSQVMRGTGKGGKLEPDKRARQQIEDARKWWMDEADAAGKSHYHEIEQVWKRQDVMAGESIIVKVWDKTPGLYLPYTLQMYQSDWLNSDYSKATDRDTLLDQGVEFNRRTGRVVAYHFMVPDGLNKWSGTNKAKRILAADVIHGFKLLQPGQLRGVTPFTPAILLADDLQEYLGANIDRAKMAAKWLAFVETDDAATWKKGTNEDSTLTLDNAIIEFLKAGEKVNINTADVPGETFTPTTKLLLQMLAISVNVPYEMLSGDYGGLNYNTMRTVRNDFAKFNRPVIKRHCRQFGTQVNRGFFDALYLSGKVDMPGYLDDPRHWQAGVWQPPGVEPLDLLRESRGHIDLVDNLLFSPQEIIAARGRDAEEVLNEAKEFKEMRVERGLDMLATSKALQTNPAVVAGGKKK